MADSFDRSSSADLPCSLGHVGNRWQIIGSATCTAVDIADILISGGRRPSWLLNCRWHANLDCCPRRFASSRRPQTPAKRPGTTKTLEMMVDRWRFEPHVIGARRGISADPEGDRAVPSATRPEGRKRHRAPVISCTKYFPCLMVVSPGGWWPPKNSSLQVASAPRLSFFAI